MEKGGKRTYFFHIFIPTKDLFFLSLYPIIGKFHSSFDPLKRFAVTVIVDIGNLENGNTHTGWAWCLLLTWRSCVWRSGGGSWLCWQCRYDCSHLLALHCQSNTSQVCHKPIINTMGGGRLEEGGERLLCCDPTETIYLTRILSDCIDFLSWPLCQLSAVRNSNTKYCLLPVLYHVSLSY